MMIATVTSVARMPMILPTDYDAVRAAILTCNILDFSAVRLVMIRDTLHLSDLIVSESLVEELSTRDTVTSVAGPFEMEFDENGTIQPLF